MEKHQQLHGQERGMDLKYNECGPKNPGLRFVLVSVLQPHKMGKKHSKLAWKQPREGRCFHKSWRLSFYLLWQMFTFANETHSLLLSLETPNWLCLIWIPSLSRIAHWDHLVWSTELIWWQTQMKETIIIIQRQKLAVWAGALNLDLI